MVAVERSWEPAAGVDRQRVIYTGEIWPLYKIFLVKLLLAIPTLGFYNFWAAAKERRYPVQVPGEQNVEMTVAVEVACDGRIHWRELCLVGKRL